MNVELSIQKKKLELIQWLSTVDDLSILNKILELRNQENKDWWESLPESERDSIEKGIADAESGKLKSHTQARKLYDKWL